MRTPLIYIIEDDEPYRSYLQILLKKHFKLEAKLFSNFVSAWSNIDKEVPDLVILDFRLPDYNGTEWMVRLSEACHLDQCHVILLTGLKMTEKEIFGMYSLGIETILTKPIDINAFVVAIQENLNVLGLEALGVE